MSGLSGDNYYNVELYYNDRTDGDGKLCLKSKLYKEDILTYLGSHFLYSNDGKVSLFIDMLYTY